MKSLSRLPSATSLAITTTGTMIILCTTDRQLLRVDVIDNANITDAQLIVPFG
jgi:hypothetical protein